MSLPSPAPRTAPPSVKPLYASAAGTSDVGVKRKNNEDAFGVGIVGIPWNRNVTELDGALSAAGVLLVVSDGLGGNNAGEVASWLAVETLQRLVAVGSESDTAAQMRAAVLATDEAVRVAAREPGQSGMGATLSALWLRDGGAVIGHVGDSRIYRWRAGVLTQLTHDHSPVGRMRQEGKISEEAARHHKFRSMIEQSLGGDPATFAPDAFVTEVALGDVFMLCSDGLTDGLRDAEIATFLARAEAGRSVREVCAAMVAAAKAASGKDNITAIVARVHDGAPVSGTGSLWRRLWS